LEPGPLITLILPLGYWALTLIDLGLTSSTLDSVRVSTPCSNSALDLSALTMVGKWIARWKAPKGIDALMVKALRLRDLLMAVGARLRARVIS